MAVVPVCQLSAEDIDSAVHILFIAKEPAKPYLNYGILKEQESAPAWDVQQKIEKESKVWIFYILLFALVLLAFTRYFYQRSVQKMLKSISSLSLSRQIFHDLGDSNMFSSFLLIIVFFISSSMWVYLIKDFIGIQTPFSDYLLWSILFVTLFALFLLKHLVLELISVMYPFGETVKLFRYNCWQLYKASSFVLLPVCFLMAFAPPFFTKLTFFISLIVLLILIIIRFAKAFSIAGKFIMHKKFLFFLYVCTLEIAPVLILGRLLYNWQVI